ncbi:unnamed protein product [Protopolystoma xenopodis]|uniref:Uncharacterized protein n=1 Tax=Protopolystoma xenopodis TaxID=117903 RepID=A0A3S5B720_9PLAT|nr:unnamed protein product [Protopolystoma xenopodis]
MTFAGHRRLSSTASSQFSSSVASSCPNTLPDECLNPQISAIVKIQQIFTEPDRSTSPFLGCQPLNISPYATIFLVPFLCMTLLYIASQLCDEFS